MRFSDEPEVTASATALSRLKRDIIAGHLVPGSKLPIRQLSETYGVGTSPMREALACLSGTGLVRLEGQKGFRVTPIGLSDLEDISRTRELVEGMAVELAINSVNAGHEADIVRALYMLKVELHHRGEGGAVWLDAFEGRHHEFHRSLIAACPLVSLKEFCDQLYLQAERYRRVLYGFAFEVEAVISEHESLSEAVLSHDVPRAQAAIVRHIRLTLELLRSMLSTR